MITYNLTIDYFGGSGIAIADAIVTAKLSRTDYFASGTVDTAPITAITDVNGQAIIPLFANTAGTQNSRYVIQILDPLAGVVTKHIIQMPEHDSNLRDLVAATTIETPGAAAASAAEALADRLLTNADVVLTNADVVTTNADVLLTNADVVTTNADVVTTNADVLLTNADVASTNADVLITNADVVLTNADVIAAAASADALTYASTAEAQALTGLDRIISPGTLSDVFDQDLLIAADLTIGSGSITSASGAISFGDENLTTTGTLAAGATDITGTLDVSGKTTLSDDLTIGVGALITSTQFGVLTGNSGDYFSTPDSAALQAITGSFDFDIRVTIPDLTPSSTEFFGAQDISGNRKWGFKLNTNGTLGIELYYTSGASSLGSSSANLSTVMSAGGTIYLRFKYTHATSGNTLGDYFTSTDGVNWTSLGIQRTSTASGLDLPAASTPLIIGGRGWGNEMTGDMFTARFYDGDRDTGTLAVDFNAGDYASGSTWTSSTTGETWTINGNASIYQADAPVIDIISPKTTTSNVIDIGDANALTTGSILNLASNSASTGSRDLVFIHNDNAAATSAIGLRVLNDASGSVATFTGAGGITVGTMLVKSGSVTDSSGAISFGDENISTTGTLAAGATDITGTLDVTTTGYVTVSHTGVNDAGLVIHNTNNTQSTAATGKDGWQIRQGQPGNYDGSLLIGQTDAYTKSLIIGPSGAVSFQKGLQIGDGETLSSSSSGSLAFIKLYDGTVGMTQVFRGPSGSGQSATLSFESFAYGDSGLNHEVVMQLKQNADQTVLADFFGAVDIASDLGVSGALSKSSGSFRIDHPLPELTETHQLVHSFTESPQADLLYSGSTTLAEGKASINIDTFHNMTEGTFEVLCRNVRTFSSNETGFNHVRCSVEGNILSLECEDSDCGDTVSWLVIGERKDQHMFDTGWTNENGEVIVEPLKPEPVPEPEPEPVQRTVQVPIMAGDKQATKLETVAVPERIEVIEGVATLIPATTEEKLAPQFNTLGVFDTDGNPVYA